MQFILKNNRRLLLTFLGLWIIVQAGLLYYQGIFIKGEAQKYLQEAEYFITHKNFSQPKYLFYSVYIFINVLTKLLNLEIAGTYCVQLLLNFVATFCFFKLSENISKDIYTAAIATILLIICFPLQNWTTHLYTESIFISLIIIFSYLLFEKKLKRPLHYSLAALSFLLLIFTRPTGLLFIPVLIFLVCLQLIQKRKWVIALFTGLSLLVIFILMLNYAMKGEGEFDFMKPFIEEHIICGVPSLQTNNRLLLPKDGNTIEGIIYYVFKNPVHFLKLAVEKNISFWGLTRSYYSQAHNLYLALFFYPLYAFALMGIKKMSRMNKAFSIFSISSIIIIGLSVSFTCDDWLNRFIMPILPFIILMAALGVRKILNRVRKIKEA